MSKLTLAYKSSVSLTTLKDIKLEISIPGLSILINDALGKSDARVIFASEISNVDELIVVVVPLTVKPPSIITVPDVSPWANGSITIVLPPYIYELKLKALRESPEASDKYNLLPLTLKSPPIVAPLEISNFPPADISPWIFALVEISVTEELINILEVCILLSTVNELLFIDTSLFIIALLTNYILLLKLIILELFE